MNAELIACTILQKYPIKRAALFGSAARGDMTENSDVDMLVEFLPEAQGLEFFWLHADLKEAFNCNVDLITYYGLHNSAKPAFIDSVLREEKVIYEHTS